MASRNAIATLILYLAGCVSANGQLALWYSVPELELGWASTCATEDVETLFSVRIYRDGRVHYFGGASVREVGERSIIVPARVVQRLVAHAKQVSEPSRAGAGLNDRSAGAPRPLDHCLTVAIAGSETSEKRLSTRSIAVLEFAREIDRQINFSRWICPPRAGDTTPFSPANYCKAPVVSLRLQSDDNCSGGHIVDVYGDGLVHYAATEVEERDGESRRLWFDDAYDRVGSRVVDELVSMVRGFHASEFPETVTPSGEPLFRYGAPDELLRLRDRIDADTRFAWGSFDSNPDCPAMADGYALATR